MLIQNKRIFVIICVFLTLKTFGQTGKITITDLKTKSPIPYAHICFEGLQTGKEFYKISDADGKTNNPCNEKSVLVVTFMGYQTYKDTINAGEDLNIILKPAVFDMDEVIVTANLATERVDKSIYNVKVINEQLIKQKGANNLSELLTNELNIRTTQDAVLGSGITIQGLSGNNVKILIDGVPVIGRMGGNIDLSQVNLYNIDHIEMVEGPMSVIYGNNALAGAINIITKENKRKRLSGTVNTYYETVGVYNFDVGTSMKAGKHVFSVSGARYFFGGFSPYDSTRSKLWKPKEQYMADLYYIYNFEKSRIKIQSSFFRETLLHKGDLLAPYFENAFDSYFYSNRLTNRAEFKKTLSNNKYLNILASHSFFNRQKRKYFNDLTKLEKTLTPNIADHDTTEFQAYTTRATFGKEKEGANLNYQFGYDFNYEMGNGKRIADGEKDMTNFGVFLTTKYSPITYLIIQPGVRLAWNSNYNVPIVPSVNMKWQLTSSMNIRGSYARGYRAPTLKELYIHFVDINHNLQPNDELKPERGHNINLAFNYNSDKNGKLHFANYEINFFYNDLENIIKLAKRKEEKEFVYKYVNITYYKTIGGNLNLQYKFYPNFTFNTGVGKTGSFFSFGGNDSNLSDFVFTTDINASANYKITAINASVSIFYKYNGQATIFEIDENNKITQGEIDNFHTLDIAGTKSFLQNRLNFNFGIKNIFDVTNINTSGEVSTGVHTSSSGNSPVAWGRTFFMKLSFDFGKID